jgi:hypothetical protein
MPIFMLFVLSGISLFAGEEAVVKKLEEVQKTLATNGLPSAYCQKESEYVEFDRLTPRDYRFLYQGGTTPEGASFEESYKVTNPEERRIFQNYRFTNGGKNAIAFGPIDADHSVERQWQFFSKDRSKNETFLWLTDDMGSGKVSDLMESVIMMIPRVTQPKVEDKGIETHVLLPTGEKVVFDKKSKMILSGALSEKPVDRNPDKYKRKFPQIDYHGYGLTIQVNTRGEDPRIMAKTASVKYQGKACTVATSELWSGAEFKFPSDNDLKSFLEKKCGYQFSF